MALKALKWRRDAVKGESRMGRFRSQWTNLANALFLYSLALEMHETAGYGKGRCTDLANRLMQRIYGYIDRYGEDCLLTALESKCGEFGFDLREVKR